MGPQELLPTGAGLVLEHAQLCGEVVHLFVRPAATGASCPICASWSEAFHSSYERNVADLPFADRQAVVHLQVRRLRCHQPTCPRKTFVEQVPALVERYARRTRRLRSDLEGIGLVLGGRPGSRLCTRQKKPTSRTTLLRLVRALPESSIETPRERGVDEFAFRRGRRSGTILVDAASHHVIDLLEDPSADALVNWLEHHPGAKVICRDRDGVYASAARRGAPDALQVADRWHLVVRRVGACQIPFSERRVSGVLRSLGQRLTWRRKPKGKRACRRSGGGRKVLKTVPCKTRVIWRKLNCLNPSFQQRLPRVPITAPQSRDHRDTPRE